MKKLAYCLMPLLFLMCPLVAFADPGPVLSPASHTAAGGVADPNAGMMRYPDVSRSHIVFVYAGDIWIVPKEGGVALPLASPVGGETTPRFNGDGSKVAFVGNYGGGTDLYVQSTAGGIAERMTFHPSSEQLCDWSPDGGLIYSTNGFSGLRRMAQLFKVSKDAPYPTQLPVPYGTSGAVSPDGKWLAYTPYSRDTRTWKRYRGGMASDVWLLNLETHRSIKVTDWEGTDTIPMWHGEAVYYLSDAGSSHRLNIWKYDTNSKTREQITKFSDYDVKWPAIGPNDGGDGEIVFQLGSDIHLLDLATGESKAIEITVPGDKPRLRPKMVDASENISGASISPSGKRVAVEARGDIWSLPASKGAPRNLTRTSGVAERYPSWSPDGRWIAYFSDATGEYELTIQQSDGRGETRRLTSDGTHWRYAPVWSPDSKMIAFSDKAAAYFLHDIESGKTVQIDRDPSGNPQSLNWSHDSRWIAYSKAPDARYGNNAIWVYNVESKEPQQLTAGYFNDSEPAFDRKGDFLYFQSNRRFSGATYDDNRNTFVYSKTGVLLALPLRKDVKHPGVEEIDAVQWDDSESSSDDDSETEDDSSKDEDANEADDAESDEDSSTDAVISPSGIDGTWAMTVESSVIPEEARNVTLVLKSDGTSVTGELIAADGQVPIQDGKFDKGTGEFTCTVESPMGTVKLSAMLSGDSMEGQAVIGAVGLTVSFKATRESSGEGNLEDGAADDDSKAAGKRGSKKPAKIEPVEIDFEDADRRVIPIPVSPGNFSSLVVSAKNHLVYRRSGTGIAVLNLYADSVKEQMVVSGGGRFELSADGKKLLVQRGSSISISEPAAGKGSGKGVSTSGMMTRIEPREEWEQIFVDAWRLERDFFYDPTMHGVDWKGVREQYAKLLPQATSRADVGFIIGEMISELNVGHAYYRGLPTDPDTPQSNAAVLGARMEVEDQRYRIAEFYEGGPWDTDAQSPLRVAGASEGQFLLEIEGAEVDASTNLFAMLQNMDGKLIELTLSEDSEIDDDDTRIAVKLPSGDANLRFRHWIENNRAYVDKKTKGKVGYIFVTDTGQPGQDDLFRQFYAQAGKEALIIDERWNGGGQIPTRFIELLNRPTTNYWARRDGRDWHWPPDSHQGPKCMLINGMSGSGGDMFPALFRQNKLGKLIGRRTWGGLVGISGGPSLIDGASVSMPSFAYYEKDGTWGIEGHGVDPDIEVIDDPSLMVDGGDPQLDAAIEHMLEELESGAYSPPARPAYPDRKRMGLPAEDR